MKQYLVLRVFNMFNPHVVEQFTTLTSAEAFCAIMRAEHPEHIYAIAHVIN